MATRKVTVQVDGTAIPGTLTWNESATGKHTFKVSVGSSSLGSLTYDDTPVPPPPPPPPPPTGSYPTWTDARFANNKMISAPGQAWPSGATIYSGVDITDESGNPSIGGGNTTAQFMRLTTREGFRNAGSGNQLLDSYTRISAQAGDHADGCQGYGGGPMLIARSTFEVTGSGVNTCIFFADSTKGTLTIQDCHFFVSAGEANYGISVKSDGATGLIMRNVVIGRNGWQYGAGEPPCGLDIECPIQEWTNVTWEDGTPIPQP